METHLAKLNMLDGTVTFTLEHHEMEATLMSGQINGYFLSTNNIF